MTTLNNYLDGRGPEDTSPQVLQRLQICGGGVPTNDAVFKDNIEKHLEISLKHSNILTEECPEGKCPRIVPAKGMELACAEEHLEEAIRIYEHNTRNKINEGVIFYQFYLFYSLHLNSLFQFGVGSLYWKQVWSLCIALWGEHSESDAGNIVLYD